MHAEKWEDLLAALRVISVVFLWCGTLFQRFEAYVILLGTISIRS